MLYKGFRRLGSMWTNETRNEENRMFSELFGVTNSFQQQLDNLVVSSGDSPAEVVQARGEYNLLYQRLDDFDVSISSNKTDVEAVGSELKTINEEFSKVKDDVKVNSSDVSKLETRIQEVEDELYDYIYEKEFKGVMVLLSGDKEINSTSWTTPDWGEVVYNISELWKPSQPKRIVVPKGVKKVKLTLSSLWPSNDNGHRRVRILKNGNYTSGLVYVDNKAGGTSATAGTSGVVEVNKGDYFEADVYQSSGESLSLRKDPYTFFSMEVVEFVKKKDEQPLIIAHRGASGTEPEHTMKAYKLAHEQGADYLEHDLQLTKDGHLICMHDDTVNRTTNGTGKVSDKTLAQIKQLDAGKGEKVPTLDEVLTYFGDDAKYYIETKRPFDVNMDNELIRVLKKHNYIGLGRKPRKIIIQSFSAESIKNIRSQFSDITFVRLIGNPSKEDINNIKEYADGIGPNKSNVTREMVKNAHEVGLFVHPYTVNTKKDMNDMFDFQVDGIFTDYTHIGFDVLNERKQAGLLK